ARVTLVHRESQMHNHVKYWIKPDIENRIKNGDIKAYFNSTVQEIDVDYVVLDTPRGPVRLKNDFVLALIGYHPDYDFLRSMGIELSADQCRPVCDPISLESNVSGIYVAGVIVAGSRTNEIFIENGRFHGRQIAEDLKKKLRLASSSDSFGPLRAGLSRTPAQETEFSRPAGRHSRKPNKTKTRTQLRVPDSRDLRCTEPVNLRCH